MTRQPTSTHALFRKALAWSVHAFTGSGAIVALFSIIAIQNHNWKLALVWMTLAVAIDGFDGWLARWANVRTYAPEIDGALLDNILDYANYVLVPALFLYEANLLPPSFALIGPSLILLASGYQFTQTDAKTDDHYFKGFPSYWNVMVFYMLLMGMPPRLNLFFLILLVILVFVPVKYVYPSRTVRLQRLTLILTFVWVGFGLIGIIQYPQVQPWIVWASFGYIGYYGLISVFPRIA